MTTFIIVIAIAAVALFIAIKTGKVKDANKNNIPDTIEEKVEQVKAVVKETKVRAKRVVEETKDVVTAVKAVGKQASQVAKATTTSEARKGRKPAKK